MYYRILIVLRVQGKIEIFDGNERTSEFAAVFSKNSSSFARIHTFQDFRVYVNIVEIMKVG